MQRTTQTGAQRRGTRTATAVAFLGGIIAATVAATAARAQVGPIPTGWGALRGASRDYVMGTDVHRGEGGQGLPGATIRSVADVPQGSAAMGQSVRASAYRGKRVRLSGLLRLADVDFSSTAVLWMRVDGGGRVQVADFMDDRPMHGNTNWTPEAIVLDVPADAVGITYGFMLDGNGQAWLDHVQLEVVGTDVAVTGHAGRVPGQSGVAATGSAAGLRAQKAAYHNARLEPVGLVSPVHGGSGE